MSVKYVNFKNLITALSCVLLVSCTTTSITQSWEKPDHAKIYTHPIIIGISDSQQTRRIYENHFVSELKKINITATPSYTLIDSKQETTGATVCASIQGTEIDSVIITYLIDEESEITYRTSPLIRGYSENIESNQISDTLVSTRGRTSTKEIVVLKTDFYDAQSRSMVWSVQTTSTSPEAIDAVVTDVTSLLINKLIDGGYFK
jgi:hypothetical protein